MGDTTRNKRSRYRDLNSQKDALEGAIATIEPPEGVEFATDEEYMIWDQFTRARRACDWRLLDLIILARIVNLEYRIRVNEEILQEEGEMIETVRTGRLMENPRSVMISKLINRQVQIIRTLSLTSGMTKSDDDNANKKGAEKAAEGGAIGREHRDPRSLLALVPNDQENSKKGFPRKA